MVELGTNELYGLDVGALKTASLQVDNHAQFNNYVDVKGGLSVGASAKIDGKLSIKGTIKATDINFTGLPTYADEAAATTGGLSTGDLYKTSTGEIRIKL